MPACTRRAERIVRIGASFAVENMIMAATYEGLGTCAMGAPLEIKADVDKFLDIKQPGQGAELELLCALVLGYPDHEPPKAPRQTEGRVTWLS
jgi:nitroreductase